VPLRQLSETVDQHLTRSSDAIEQLVGFDDVEDSGGGGDTDRVATKGVEISNVPAEVGHHLVAADNGSDRYPVAHRLSHDGKVGHQPVPLEPPPRGSEPAEPRLNFVGDPQPAGLPYRTRRRFQKARRIGLHSIAGHDGVHNHAGESHTTVA
jgi:hypothetical protein